MFRAVQSLALTTLVAALISTSGAPASAAAAVPLVHVGGGAATVSLAAGQDGLVKFTAASGSQVTVSTARGTFADCDVLVSIRRGARDLTEPVCGGTSVTLPAFAARPDRPATYTVVLDVQGGAAGSIDVSVAGSGPKALTLGAGEISLTVPPRTVAEYQFLAPAGASIVARFGGTTTAAGRCAFVGSILQHVPATQLLATTCLGRAGQVLTTAAPKASGFVLSLTNLTSVPRTVTVGLASAPQG